MTNLRRKCRKTRMALLSLSVLATFAPRAEITTDGTVGPALQLPGPDFLVPENIGSRIGDNLFHSFGVFDLHRGESATFTGAGDITNVISRVTGGQATTINGLLRSQIGQADFYFINPAGMLFGADAVVDVPVAFHASTADQLQFADGARFDAVNPAASTLTVAAPAAFGFLRPHSAGLTVDRSSLHFAPGSDVSLSAGTIDIRGGDLSVEGGGIRLTAVGKGTGPVSLRGAVPAAAAGVLTMESASLSSSGDGGGSIVIRAGDARITDSQVMADNSGANDAQQGIDLAASSLTLSADLIATAAQGGGDGGSVDIAVGGALQVLDGSAIGSTTYSAGDAGNVAVVAGDLVVAGGVGSETAPGSSGNAGEVNVIAQRLTVADGGLISSNTAAAGDAGAVSIEADHVTIDGKGGFAGVQSIASPDSTGDAGALRVVAGTMEVFNEGIVSSGTEGAGNAGEVEVQAGDLVLDGQGGSAVIGSEAGSGSSGGAGAVRIEAGTMALLQGGVVTSSTSARGSAGTVTVQAERLVVDGQGGFAGIESLAEPGSVGNAGEVRVTAADLAVLNGGLISSGTSAAGDAGTARVSAGRLLIDGQGRFAGIGSVAGPDSSGEAGDVEVSAAELNIVRGGFVSTDVLSTATATAGTVRVEAYRLVVDGAGSDQPTGIFSESTAGTGPAGDVSVSGGSIRLVNGGFISSSSDIAGNAGDIDIEVTERLVVDRARITTEANEGDGGAIRIHGGTVILRDGLITTSVEGGGAGLAGGGITLTPEFLVLDTGFIQANSTSPGGRGGDVLVDTRALVASRGSVRVGGGQRQTFQAGIEGFNVIQAVAPEGVGGTVQVTSPELDISASLASLSAKFLDLEDIAGDPCRRFGDAAPSSLAPVGRGGLAPVPEDAGSAFLGGDRLDRVLREAARSAAGSMSAVRTLHVSPAPSMGCSSR